MNYYLIALGCQMNLSDAERIRTILKRMGYEEATNEQDAHILGVVACSVRQKAIDKVYTKINTWNNWKKEKNLLTFLSGCVLPTDKKKLLTRFDFIFDIKDLVQLPQMIRSYGILTPISFNAYHSVQSFWDVPASYTSTFEAYVPIQNGCDKFCTFCAVPYTRGREYSRPSSNILQEVQTLIMKGYKSITLLGQNVNSYGLDNPKNEINFAELLQEIGKIGNQAQQKCWIYFTSPHPHDMTEDVLHIVRQYPVLAKNIHLPLQSGDDKILIRMNRNYRVSHYRKIVHRIRALLPNATLFTDIIVGFSDETTEQFLNTAQAMQEFRYNMAFIAPYSPRPGAASYRWKDDITIAEKKSRYRHLTKILAQTALMHNQDYIGKECNILIYAPARNEGYLNGRTEGRIPIQVTSNQKELVGTFQRAYVTHAQPFSLFGRII